MKIIHKITYSNGKIYIGSDNTDDILYFGTPDRELVQKDFSREQRRNFVIRRDILLELSDDIPDPEVRKIENKYILENKSNDPSIGYNQTPKFKK